MRRKRQRKEQKVEGRNRETRNEKERKGDNEEETKKKEKHTFKEWGGEIKKNVFIIM